MKIESIQNDEIKFDNGSRLVFEHYQDCCEKVYADCKNIQSLSSENFRYNKVEFDEPPQFAMVEGVGVELIARTGMRYLISCYNIQNGYYSSNLSMTFIDANGNRTELVDDVEKKDNVY